MEADRTLGIQRGFLRKYGGFMFKQWKEKYLVLTAEGSVLVCRDADSPPDQVVALQGGCEAIVEGKEILDLPRLPLGARRDCCLALILPQYKFLLLLADSPNECSQWLNMMRKVRESILSPLRSCKHHQGPTQSITDHDPLSEPVGEKEPLSPRFSDKDPPTPGTSNRDAPNNRDRGNKSPWVPRSAKASPHPSPSCLRHGTSSDAQAVRAVYLLMGGAAASSALGYLGSCSSPPPDVRPADVPSAVHLASGGAHHSCSQAVDSPHFDSFDFEGDSDFDAFDCGGFAF